MTHSDVGDDTGTTGRGVAGASRRTLIGSALAGAVVAVAAGRSVAAGPANPVAGVGGGGGDGTTGGDDALLVAAMQLELAARDLYDGALAADRAVDLAGAMREQHEAYAQAIAGLTGVPANRRDDAAFDEMSAGFEGSDQAVAAAAYDLESALVATHTELIGLVESADAARLLASIVVIEARHCAVLADAAGLGDDLDALLVNDADPMLPEDLS